MLGSLGKVDFSFAMHEVTSISKRTVPISEENNTLFGLVETVFLIIFAKFMRTVSKLALIAVGTIAVFDELFAQLKLFFVGRPE